MWAPSVLPGVLMLLVGALWLTGPSLGWDENATWSVSRRSVAQIGDLAGNIDGVIAPYYLVMHYWTAVAGDSVVALRLPSLVAVALGVGLAAELGRRLFGARAGLVGGLFLAAVPQLSRYAQDARAYGFAFLFAVLATLLLHLAVTRPSRWRWAGYTAAVALLGLSHLFGLLVLAGHLVIARHRLRPWAVAAALGVLPAVPLVILGLGQVGVQLDWIGEPTLTTVLEAPGTVFASAAVGWALVGLAFTVRGGDRRTTAGLVALAAVPPALLIAVSFLRDPLFLPRYVLPAVVPVALLAAAALRDTPRRAAAAVVVVALAGVPGQLTVRGPNAHVGLDFRAAARIVRAHQLPGDGIVYGRIGTWSLRAGMNYQLRHDDAPQDVLLRRSAAAVGGLDGVECPSLACFDTDRVWYVGQRREGRDPMQDAGIKLRRHLESAYRLTSAWELPSGTVRLYQRL